MVDEHIQTLCAALILTSSEMTYTVSGAALNSTQSNPIFWSTNTKPEREHECEEMKTLSAIQLRPMATTTKCAFCA